jgi:phosphoribosylformylglycinamidine synthase
VPRVDFEAHRAVCALVAGLVAAQVGGSGGGLVRGVHDVSGGGLAVAVAEMAADSGVGAVLEVAGGPSELFTELPSRFLVATSRPDELAARAAESGIPASVLGRAGGDRVVLGDQVDLGLETVRAAYEGNLTRALGDP